MNWQETIKRPDGVDFCWADLHTHTPIGPDFSLAKGLSINNETEKTKVVTISS